jgi:creatinine amidohydrolase
MKKVRYEEMLPHEIVAVRRDKPVAYLPMGILEWHGEHLGVGNDALKAQRLCELAAEQGGGLALPPMWYGEPRVTGLMEANHDPDGRICEKMQLNRSDFITTQSQDRDQAHGQGAEDSNNPFGASAAQQIQLYRSLVRHVLIQIRTLGFKAIVMLTGHYPLYDWSEPVVKAFNRQHKDCRAFVGIEFHYDIAAFGHEEIGGDHAAKWETSYLMALRPECVDMTVYHGRPAEEPLIGVDGEDPRVHATKQLGESACQLIVRGMIRKGNRLLGKTKHGG